MKIIRIVVFIVLTFSNIVFFVYGWIKKIDCDNQKRINVELHIELETKNKKILGLENQLMN